MKKLAFTMPELIITLAIIGVAASIAAPVMTNIMPDKYKLKALEYYNMIDAATEEFLSNEAVYYAPDADHDGLPDCEGLFCESVPLISPYNNANINGDLKYCYLLGVKLGLSGAVTDTDSRTYSDGSVWSCQREDNATENNYRIKIDVDPSNSDNCIFVTGTCETPDTFVIRVDNAGNATAADAMLEAYLQNRLNMHAKKEDKAAATTTYATGGIYTDPYPVVVAE